MNTRDSAFAAIRWTSFAMLGRAGIAVLQIVVLSRILDPADFKLVAIAGTIINVGIVFTDMGISFALIRFRDVTDEELASLFWLNIMVGGAITLIVAASSPLVARFYGDPRLIPLVLIESLLFVVVSIGQQQRTLAEKGLRFDVLFQIDVGSAFVGFLVAVVLALFGFGASAIVIGNLIYAIGIATLSWILLADGWRPTRTFSWTAAKRFISFGSNVMGVSMLSALVMNGDIILGGRLIPGAALGYYFQPRDLCVRIMFLVSPIVNRVSFPLLASMAHDKVKVRSVYLKALNMTASVNFPIYAFLAIFSPEVVAIVLGPKWGPSVPIMRVLAIWCAVRSISNPIGSLLFAMGETRRAMVSSVLIAVALFVFVALGAPFGVIGIPVALTALYAILIPVLWASLVHPACGASFRDYHLTLLWPGISTLCAACVSLLILGFVQAPFARLVLGGGAGAAVYIASSWLLNKGWLMSMTELLMIGRLREKFARSMS